MLKAVIFDFDGVIVDSEITHHLAFNDVMKTVGVEFDFDTYTKHLIGFDDRDAFRFMLTNWAAAEHRVNMDDRILQMCFEKQMCFNHRVETEGMTPVAGALDLVDALRAADVPIAIASGATREDIRLILDQLGKTDLFPVIVSANDVARSKPDPETYTKAVEDLGKLYPASELTPATCLAIEDSPTGLTSALGAGLKTLALATTHQPEAVQMADRVEQDLQGVTWNQLQAWYGENA